MSRLSRVTIDGVEVLMRDGMSLHSRRDYLSEAQIWAEKQSAALKNGVLQGPVFILGCGAFHHIRALAKVRPELCIVGIDFDDELLAEAMDFNMVLTFRDALKTLARISFMIAQSSACSEADKKALFEMGYSVLRFRPAWVGFEDQYSALEATLLDSTPEAVIKWQETKLIESSNLTEEEKVILALKDVVS